MKKIILFLILLFNLVPYMDKGKLKINCQQAVAQNMGEEDLEEVCVEGFSDITVDEVPGVAIYTTDCTGSKDCNTGEVFWEDCNTTVEILGGNGDGDGDEDEPDCSGTIGGSAYYDGCGNCVGGYTGLTDCYYTSNYDCAGTVNGSAYMDNCNHCVGGSTGLAPCSPDCPGGGYRDNCYRCVGGSTGLTPCVPDCAGVENGSAVYVTNCGCTGGTTGLLASQCPCKTADEQNNTKVTSDYSERADLYAIANFTPLTTTSTGQDEQSFEVEDDGTKSPVQTYNGLNGSITVYTNTILTVHTHPAEGFPAHSAGDIASLYTGHNYASGYVTSYVVAADGSKYALFIDNPTAFNTFMANNPNSISGPDFVNTSTLGATYNAIRTNMEATGLTANQSHERAMAFILKDAGVSLMKQMPGTTEFKKIGTVQKFNSDGTPAVNGSGNPIYINADCR